MSASRIISCSTVLVLLYLTPTYPFELLPLLFLAAKNRMCTSLAISFEGFFLVCRRLSWAESPWGQGRWGGFD